MGEIYYISRTALTVFTFIISTWLVRYLWNRDDAPGAKPLAGFAFLVAVWSVGAAGEIQTDDFTLKVIFHRLQHFPIAMAPFLWLTAAIDYTGRRHWLTHLNLSFILGLPLFVWLLMLTNRWHMLIFLGQQFRVASPFLPLFDLYGFVYFSFLIFELGIFLFAAFILAESFFRVAQPRWRLEIVTLLMLIPVSVFVLRVIPRLTPFTQMPEEYIVILPLFMSTVTYAVVRYRLFDLLPVPRQSIIQNVRDGILVVNAVGRVVDVNMPLLNIFQQQDHEILGQPVTAVLSKFPELLKAYEDDLQGTREIRLRVGPALKNYDYQENPLLSEMGGTSTQGWVLTLRDITERKQVEQMREDLINTMVHDLRNPLALSFNSLDWMQRQLEEMSQEELRESLDMARTGIQQLLDLVNQILDISRLESGSVPLNEQWFEVDGMVTSILNSHKHTIDDKHLTVINHIQADLPLAWGDANMLKRVFQNLIDNAVKFTPDGGEIELNAQLEGENHIEISVQDNGRGIPPDLQARLFQKFSRGDSVGRGSGLGLAFCRMALEAHEEKIWLDERYRDGARFVFRIRTAVPQNQAIEATPTSQTAELAAE